MKVLDILTSPWAILPDQKLEIDGIYLSHLRGEKIDRSRMDAFVEAAVSSRGSTGATDPDYQVIDGVAVLDLEGILAKRMNLFMYFCGGTSYELFGNVFQTALDDPLVQSILLRVDSPGGSVDGLFELGDRIFNARGTKPIVAVAYGMMASAAYLIGSAASRVYVTDSAGIVGSIGVVQTHVDVSGAEQQRGVKTTEITSGKFKRIASSYAPLSVEGRQTLQDQSDYLYGLFLDDVTRNRGAISSEAVHESMADGRIFFGQQAVDAGLVDGVSTIADVIAMLSAGQIDPATTGASAAVVRSAASTTPHAAGDATGTSITTEEPHMADKTITAEEAKPFVDAALRDQQTAFDARAGELRAEGATAERERIQSVFGQLMPGHEALIQTLAFDGKTSGEQAAVAVLKGEREKKAQMTEQLRADAPKPVVNTPSADAPQDENAPKAVDPVPTAQKAQLYIAEQAKLGHKVGAAEAVAHVTKEAK